MAPLGQRLAARQRSRHSSEPRRASSPCAAAAASRRQIAQRRLLLQRRLRRARRRRLEPLAIALEREAALLKLLLGARRRALLVAHHVELGARHRRAALRLLGAPLEPLPLARVRILRRARDRHLLVLGRLAVLHPLELLTHRRDGRLVRQFCGFGLRARGCELVQLLRLGLLQRAVRRLALE